MFGTPASNLFGDGAHLASVIVTDSIIEPPVKNGSISFRYSLLPHKIPIPVGPSALCPEKARKSISSAFTSIAKCGADWQASRTTTAPTECAFLTISSRGIIVPRTFD